MPLAFESLSHGTIAFGFFNIESDMLLLDRYFLFAEDFCSYLKNIAQAVGDQPYHTRWKDEIRPGYVTVTRDIILQNCKGIFSGIAFEDS